MSQDKTEIVVEADLDEAPGDVWRALTEPDLRAAWLGEDDASVGHVREAEPGRRLAWAWRGPQDDRPSTVEIELSPREDGGTRFRLVHSAQPMATVMGFPRRVRTMARGFPRMQMRLAA